MAAMKYSDVGAYPKYKRKVNSPVKLGARPIQRSSWCFFIKNVGFVRYE
jgi:hypothetical protein